MFAFKLSVKQCKKARVRYIEEGRIADLLVYCDQIHLLYFPHLEAQQ